MTKYDDSQPLPTRPEEEIITLPPPDEMLVYFFVGGGGERVGAITSSIATTHSCNRVKGPHITQSLWSMEMSAWRCTHYSWVNSDRVEQ